MLIRKAEEKDIERLLEIYNYEVVNGVATLDIDEKTYEQWREWFYSHNIKNHPLIVCEKQGAVVGYASLSSYRQKQAYYGTVELSVYVHNDFKGIGVGSRLLSAILEIAREDDSIHTVISVITSGNEASERLHEKFGFEFCGKIREAGEKFGRYVDISNYQLIV